eukprot:2396405-Rhodomonas_salina.3
MPPSKSHGACSEKGGPSWPRSSARITGLHSPPPRCPRAGRFQVGLGARGRRACQWGGWSWRPAVSSSRSRPTCSESY